MASKWTVGVPSKSATADGTATASVPLLDNGQLAATLSFTITAGRVLDIRVTNEPGTVGLADFRAWSDR